jgi:hypothetical protein
MVFLINIYRLISIQVFVEQHNDIQASSTLPTNRHRQKEEVYRVVKLGSTTLTKQWRYFFYQKQYLDVTYAYTHKSNTDSERVAITEFSLAR